MTLLWLKDEQPCNGSKNDHKERSMIFKNKFVAIPYKAKMHSPIHSVNCKRRIESAVPGTRRRAIAKRMTVSKDTRSTHAIAAPWIPYLLSNPHRRSR